MARSRIPGFTADAALAAPLAVYASMAGAARGGRHEGVTPQGIDPWCVISNCGGCAGCVALAVAGQIPEAIACAVAACPGCVKCFT
jgi:hypothetical protein